MRIVQIIHGFPPHNIAGSEVYTYNLSQELARKDEVFVFYRIADPEKEEYEMTSGEYNGIQICMINNTFKLCDSFEKTYRNDIIAERFGQFLDEVKPDVTHFGHVTCLSTTLIAEAKRRKIPVVFTLHDFWLFCQLGQLLKQDLSRCNGPNNSECTRCMAPQLAIQGSAKRVLEFVKKKAPNFQTKALQGKFLKEIHRQYVKASFLFQAGAHSEIQKRNTHIKEMCSLVDLFIAPSKFLLRKFIEFGIPGRKILYYDYGFDTALFEDAIITESQKIRVGYIGTFIPSKGVHVLLEAINSIQNQDVELRIHGKFVPYHPGFEDYPDHLKAMGKRDNILWLGEYDNRSIARILSEIDVLVVPSIWYENSPLTIHEAFMAGVPVITSNIGGMAELVEDGVDGFHFQVGDSKDLARKIQTLINDRCLIERLRKNIKPVVAMEEHVLEVRELYCGLVY